MSSPPRNLKADGTWTALTVFREETGARGQVSEAERVTGLIVTALADRLRDGTF